MEGEKESHTFWGECYYSKLLIGFFFHVVSVRGGWVMIAKTFTFGVFWPLSGYKTPPIVARVGFPYLCTVLYITALFYICTNMLL